MPTYNIVKDDSFTRANTSVGTGANSTNVGNGWVDFQGTFWNIVSNVLGSGRVNNPGTNLPLNCIYDGANSFRDGYSRSWSSGGSDQAVVGRFNPASGGSGYAVLLYGHSQIYFYKAVNGTASTIAAGVALGGTAPTDYVLEMSIISTDSSTSQITVNVYAQTDLNTVLYTHTFTDTTAALQNPASSYWGGDTYGGNTIARLQTAQVSTVLTAGTVSIINRLKTKAHLQAGASTGGSGTLTYQWQRALGAGSFSNLSGATSTDLTDTSLTPGATYRYQLITTDGLGATVTSAITTITTYAANAKIIGFVGDSITYGLGSTVKNGAQTCIDALVTANSSLYGSYYVNSGISGTTTANWTSGIDSAITTFLANEVNLVLIDLGVNDSSLAWAYSAATYRANMVTILGKLATAGITVILNAPTYVIPSGGWDSTSLTLLQAYATQLDSLENGTTVLHGDRKSYADFAANTAWLASSNPHPNDAGYADLGANWAAAVIVALTSAFRPRSPRRGLNSFGSGVRR